MVHTVKHKHLGYKLKKTITRSLLSARNVLILSLPNAETKDH